MTEIEFLRVARLSGQHLSVPRSFLREQGFSGSPGNKNEYAALFRAGRVLLAVLLGPDEGVADAERVVQELIGGQSEKKPKNRSVERRGVVCRKFLKRG